MADGDSTIAIGASLVTSPQILVVDDSGENRLYIRHRLQQDGYQVVVAESGPEGLELLESVAVDLVILDVQMPGMDGLETLAEMRRRHPLRRLPVLMLSADTQTARKVEALELGAEDYLPKPLEYEFLLAKLRQHLRPPVVVHPQEGQLFGHYELLQLLGEGGMGRVFRARDERLQREVALKMMTSTPADGLQRLLREARALSRLHVAALPTIYEVGELPLPFIAMELVTGKTLHKHGRVPGPVATRWIGEVAEALQVVHEHGVLHRDLKPSNLMLSETGSLKILDFGLAKSSEDQDQLTKTGEIWGTPQYMAPEHFDRNLGPVDAMSDVYALGVILYELLSGAPPFSSDSLGVLIRDILEREPAPLEDVVPELRDICFRALARERARRYGSAGELARDLLPLAGEMPAEVAVHSEDDGPETLAWEA
jgi:CheY-like chemotaxis protein/predicted Ser/Thr protein kinase